MVNSIGSVVFEILSYRNKTIKKQYGGGYKAVSRKISRGVQRTGIAMTPWLTKNRRARRNDWTARLNEKQRLNAVKQASKSVNSAKKKLNNLNIVTLGKNKQSKFQNEAMKRLNKITDSKYHKLPIDERIGDSAKFGWSRIKYYSALGAHKLGFKKRPMNIEVSRNRLNYRYLGASDKSFPNDLQKLIQLKEFISQKRFNNKLVSNDLRELQEKINSATFQEKIELEKKMEDVISAIKNNIDGRINDIRKNSATALFEHAKFEIIKLCRDPNNLKNELENYVSDITLRNKILNNMKDKPPEELELEVMKAFFDPKNADNATMREYKRRILNKFGVIATTTELAELGKVEGSRGIMGMFDMTQVKTIHDSLPDVQDVQRLKGEGNTTGYRDHLDISFYKKLMSVEDEYIETNSSIAFNKFIAKKTNAKDVTFEKWKQYRESNNYSRLDTANNFYDRYSEFNDISVRSEVPWNANSFFDSSPKYENPIPISGIKGAHVEQRYNIHDGHLNQFRRPIRSVNNYKYNKNRLQQIGDYANALTTEIKNIDESNIKSFINEYRSIRQFGNTNINKLENKRNKERISILKTLG